MHTMKKLFPLYPLLVLASFLAVPAQSRAAQRALFVTTIQNVQVLNSREEIMRLVDFAQEAHIKTIYVQIYRANQAWFASELADVTPYRACYKSLSEDPLALLISQAHRKGIKVHAWLNLLSLSTNKDAPILKKYGASVLTRNRNGKKKLEDFRIDNQYFLEPGDLRVREELIGIVDEILTAYPSLDGILFDYIRYPDRNPAYGYTKMNIERYRTQTGNKTAVEESREWKDWKRQQVNELLTALVNETRRIAPHITIGATGCAPYVRAYHEAFQDWPSWLKDDIVDYVTLMSYAADTAEFTKQVAEARTKVAHFRKVNVAVGAYKLLEQPEKFFSHYRLCETSDCNDCVVFHYGNARDNENISAYLTDPEAVIMATKKQNF